MPISALSSSLLLLLFMFVRKARKYNYFLSTDIEEKYIYDFIIKLSHNPRIQNAEISDVLSKKGWNKPWRINKHSSLDSAKSLKFLKKSLYKKQDVSECVCLFPNSSKTTKPDELKFWGMILLEMQYVLS